MYKAELRRSPKAAFFFYVVDMLGLLLMGIMYKSGIKNTAPIYLIIFAAMLMASYLIDQKNLLTLIGIKGKHIKLTLPAALIICAAAFALGTAVFDSSIKHQIYVSAYFLFYISLIEELCYRGFIQNDLFGLKMNRNLTVLIGAVMFSLMHLPFQMFAKGGGKLSYIVKAVPQLIGTFQFHLLLVIICLLTGDVLIATALHYAADLFSSYSLTGIIELSLFIAMYVFIVIDLIRYFIKKKTGTANPPRDQNKPPETRDRKQ
ncbi:MAG: CPBP family intramembrane metalloprotease [Ruminococcus sp.]|nr:CPBP family intramembrane metalloprotease [Ruminococcus sp.]